MSDRRYVLDSNIITALLKKEAITSRHISEALATDAEFLMCPVVYYEVYRGLLHRDAKKQLGFFLQFTSTFYWDDLNHDDWERAAKYWASLHAKGNPIEDADLLIGTYAAQRDAIVVTDNESHFLPLGLSIENWRH